MRAFLLVIAAGTIVGIACAQEPILPGDSTQSALPVVDVRTLAMQQVEEAKHNEQNIQAEAIPLSPEIQIRPLLIAVVVSLAGTIGLVLLLVRTPQRVQTPAPLPPMEPSRPKTQNSVDALLRQAHRILLEKRVASSSRIPVTTHAAGPNLSLAERFGRGRGELALVQKLAVGKEHSWWEKNIREMDTSLNGQNIEAAAKKFGVGTGELHLAQTLRLLQEQQRKVRS